MGALVEGKLLSLKDLGYAVENAWDEKVRQAAIALSLVRLNQAVLEPVPPAGFVHFNFRWEKLCRAKTTIPDVV